MKFYSSAGTLVISFIGMQSQEVKIKPNVNVVLHADSHALEEVVVVAYGTASKQSLTGAVASLDAKEMELRPVTQATNALEGAAPGIQVNNSYGEPGSDKTSIRIRGFGSINGSNEPLIVVDGSPYSGNLNDINPQDIESMSVLKDASSAALYGNKVCTLVLFLSMTSWELKTGWKQCYRVGAVIIRKIRALLLLMLWQPLPAL